MGEMKNIVLTGFMGTGKTAVGKELSKIMNMRLVDVDSAIEEDQKMKISQIFQDLGEERFREIETNMIRKLSGEHSVIISTGGGAVLREENMEILRKSGLVFCLSASAETVLERTAGSDERPLLNVENPLARIRELLDFRRPFYGNAGTVIDTEGKTPLQVALEIAGMVQCRK